jgi:hypothetical protein
VFCLHSLAISSLVLLGSMLRKMSKSVSVAVMTPAAGVSYGWKLGQAESEILLEFLSQIVDSQSGPVPRELFGISSCCQSSYPSAFHVTFNKTQHRRCHPLLPSESNSHTIFVAPAQNSPNTPFPVYGLCPSYHTIQYRRRIVRRNSCYHILAFFPSQQKHRLSTLPPRVEGNEIEPSTGYN